MQTRLRLRTYTPQTADGQRRKKSALLTRRECLQSVGLARVGKDLCNHLSGCNARADGQANGVEDLRPNVLRKRDCAVQRHVAEVDERFIHRQALHRMTAPFENPENRARNLAILLHIRPHDDKLRARSQRLPKRHGGLYAERARFIRRSQHNCPAARARDGNRQPSQLGIVPYFDACVKRIDVKVPDHVQKALRAKPELVLSLVEGRPRFAGPPNSWRLNILAPHALPEGAAEIYFTLSTRAA